MSVSLVHLPSLDLLRGFVAVGRRMSITLAAKDLCITQSAVSKQIQALEDVLGIKLLIRRHRAIAFTPEGERLFKTADIALQQIQDVVGIVKGSVGQRIVTVTSTVGVAGLWLLERLGTFIDLHPDIDVRVSANSRAVDLKSEGIDLAIRYGARGAVPDNAEFLFAETIAPVVSPSLCIDTLVTPASLEGQVLLEFDGPYRPWLQWNEWLVSQGWRDVRPRAILRFNQYDQIIHAAIAGRGIALGRSPLISTMLADGRLKALQTRKGYIETEHAYWLIGQDGDPRPEVVKVMQWIRDQATMQTANACSRPRDK